MSARKHNALPWHIRSVPSDPGFLVRAAGGGTVAHCGPETYHGADDFETGVANAEFIVRAVNSYDELLAACQAWFMYFEHLDNISDPNDRLCQERRKFHASRIEATRAAIAKATGAAVVK